MVSVVRGPTSAAANKKGEQGKPGAKAQKPYRWSAPRRSKPRPKARKQPTSPPMECPVPDLMGASAPLPTDIYVPPRSRLQVASSPAATGESGTNHASMVGDQLEQNLIRDLLCSANLQMPDQYVMKKMGTISIKQNSTLISCLLFKRDETSEGVVIFDIVRLATKTGWQRRGYATRCLNALIDLLCYNFPRRKIILRVGVLRLVGGFYKKAGFVKGVPKGYSEGRFCGQSDCDVHHLIQEPQSSDSRNMGNATKIHDTNRKQMSNAKSDLPRLGRETLQRKSPDGQSVLNPSESRVEEQQQTRLRKTPPTWLLQSNRSKEEGEDEGEEGDDEEETETEDEEEEEEEETETEGDDDDDDDSNEEEDEDQPTPPRKKKPAHQTNLPRPSAGIGISQTQNSEHQTRPPLPSLLQRPQLQQPNIEIFCSSHSQMRVRDQANFDMQVSEVGQIREDAIQDFLDKMRLIPLENMRKVGSVCVKIRQEELVSCLLFIRDDASLAASTRIFDIARFTVGSDAQSQVDANLCLKAFATLLRQNFPCTTIIVRAAVIEKAQSFYERAGFRKGVPPGVPEGLYCGHSDCKIYHLVVQKYCPTSGAKKRERVPAHPKSTKPFQVQDCVVWRSKTRGKRRAKDLVFGSVEKVHCENDSNYRYFVKWDGKTPCWVDHKNLLTPAEAERRCSAVSKVSNHTM